MEEKAESESRKVESGRWKLESGNWEKLKVEMEEKAEVKKLKVKTLKGK